MTSIVLLSPSLPRRALLWIGSARAAMSTNCARVVDVADRLPRFVWPLLVLAASWPSIVWAARRLGDGSDDPLGIVALVALLVALVVARRHFDETPRRAWMGAAAALAVAANLPIAAVPDLLRALMAIAALVCALVAIARRDQPVGPYAGLAILALPLLSSLQFYAGFPLRVVTAEASRWLLIAMGSSVERMGSALTVDGRLVLVDAPCSGVQMAWVGYFTACAIALMTRVSDRAFFARLPLVGAAVLIGNIARNTVLVAVEAGAASPMSTATHEAVGLATLTLVCGAIVMGFVAARVEVRAPRFDRVPRALLRGRIDGTHGALAMVLVGAAVLGIAGRSVANESIARVTEWPDRFDGQPLVPLALSPVELRFAAQFPGSIARFAQDTRTVILRDVERPTRRLHPAVDCYRGIGYAIAAEHLETDRDARLWRCFTATRDGRALRVCERIVDAEGHAYTDVSSWYWSAAIGRSHGPWRAITIASPIALDRGARS